MKNLIFYMAFVAVCFTSCQVDTVDCLESKLVKVQTIQPSATICEPEKGDFQVVSRWDTLQTVYMSECEAQQQLEELNKSWEVLLNEHQENAGKSTADSVFYAFIIDNPPSFNIIDDEN